MAKKKINKTSLMTFDELKKIIYDTVPADWIVRKSNEPPIYFDHEYIWVSPKGDVGYDNQLSESILCISRYANGDETYMSSRFTYRIIQENDFLGNMKLSNQRVFRIMNLTPKIFKDFLLRQIENYNRMKK